MGITENTTLPTEEELTVPEVNLSGPALKAGAFHLGKACEWENNEFILCRNESKDPRKCIKEGKAVTSCTLNFFRRVKRSCAGEFNQYVNCLDKSSINQNFSMCRKTQAVLDKCMVDNLGIERPYYGYFTEVKVHKTNRPKPIEEGPAVYPDATPYLPEGIEKPPAKYGLRFHWIW